jgi:hypothetical protein
MRHVQRDQRKKTIQMEDGRWRMEDGRLYLLMGVKAHDL